MARDISYFTEEEIPRPRSDSGLSID